MPWNSILQILCVAVGLSVVPACAFQQDCSASDGQSSLTRATGSPAATRDQLPVSGLPMAFTRPDSRGNPVAVGPDPAIKATVICFLGTECPVAQFYAPRLSRIAVDYEPRGVKVVGVLSCRQDSDADLVRFAGALKPHFPLIRDPDQQIANAYQARRTPEVVLLDSDFVIRYRGRVDDQYSPGVKRAAAEREDLKIALDQLLDGREISLATTEPTGCLIGRVSVPAADSIVNPRVTWSREISRLLQKHCVECHRAGEIGPFSLERFEDAQGWADTCLEVISNGRMPPWHATTEHGSFANARVMPDADKQRFRDWVALGMPFGSADELPAPLPPVSEWQLSREPDLILPMRDKPYSIPAEGTVEYQYFVIDPGFREDRWVTSAQIIPGNRALVHHAIAFIRPPDGGEFRGVSWLTAYVPGQRLPRARSGYARRVPAGSKLVFQMHYTPNGTAGEDLTRVGMLFEDESSVTHELITVIGIDQDFVIPRESPDFAVHGDVRWFPKHGQLLSLAPHMHLRGKSFEVRAELADREISVLTVPSYDFNWQHSYELAEPLPLDSVRGLKFTAGFDNSRNNPWNPDPSQVVTWGDQTWEEMAVVFLEVAEPRQRNSPSDSAASENQGEGQAAAEQDADRERRINEFVEDFFARLDVNQDGQVLRAEVPLAVRNTFGRFDRNNDLKADRDEVRAIAEQRLRPVRTDSPGRRSL